MRTNRSQLTTPWTTACSPKRMTLPGAETNHPCFRDSPLPSLETAAGTAGALVYMKGDLSSPTEGKRAGSCTPASISALSRSSSRSCASSIPTHNRMRSSGRPRAARVAESIEACLQKAPNRQLKQREQLKGTYDIAQGMLMSELTAPKLTLIPHKRVAPTIRSLSSLLPVVKLSTAPGPLASRSWISFPGCPGSPG